MEIFTHRTGHQLQVDDATIYWESTGSPQAPVLLVLHGGFGNLEDFNPLIARIALDLRIIGVDTRGHGRSSAGSAALTYERAQRDVEAVLDAAGVDTLCVLGFSDGGTIALRLAALSERKIGRVICVGTHWHIRNTEPLRELFARVDGESWKARFPHTYEAYQALNPSPRWEAFARSVVALWTDPGPSGYPGDAVGRIACPLLVARGDEDRLVSRSDAFELAAAVPGSTLLNLPFASHSILDERPGLMAEFVIEFLGRPAPEGGPR